MSLESLRRLEALSPRGMKLGLGTIGAVCDRLGRPERRFPSVLIAGTNGKGSTAATLSALATAAGMKTGLYTSPHLMAVTERIRVDDEDVSEERLDSALEAAFRAADAAPAVALTYFEALTAAAFRIFAEMETELGVLEVGLGGRLDATNVAPASLSLVTSIGLDHTEELGSTLPEIAREKAGVFRSGRPALALARDSRAREALRESAERAGARWHDAAKEITVEVERTDLDGTHFRLQTPERGTLLRTPLPGEHQAWNTALAIRAAELLGREEERLALAAREPILSNVRWPGRLESFPVRGRRVVLDGCHNSEGAGALAGFLSRAGLAGRCPLLFGAMADKDIEGIASALFPAAARVVLVPTSSPRAATPDELARRTRSVRPDAERADSLAGALDALLALSDSAPIIVAGSLYLVGEARARLVADGTKTR